MDEGSWQVSREDDFNNLDVVKRVESSAEINTTSFRSRMAELLAASRIHFQKSAVYDLELSCYAPPVHLRTPCRENTKRRAKKTDL